MSDKDNRWISMRRYFFIIILLLFPFLTGYYPILGEPVIPEIAHLELSDNEPLSKLRDDIRKSIHVIKSQRPATELPELTFYAYTVKNGDNFWKIASRATVTLDTLMTVNGFSSPKDIQPGTTVYIPNMRGILIPADELNSRQLMLRQERITLPYIRQVNRSSRLDKKYLFIPCGRVEKLERSLFLGTAFLYPLKGGRQSSGFGTRRSPFHSHRNEFHSGIDIACPSGTAVHAARAGRVIFAGVQGGYGKLVVVQHEHGFLTYYGHLSRILVRPGERVAAGHQIALSGNTGRSTGPHLHFEIRKDRKPVNPAAYLRRAPHLL